MAKKATEKAAKKSSPKKKKLDGKALAAKRKPRDSVAQFIKDELTAGKSDIDKIIERAKADFPKATPTRGYVRWIARQIGREKQVPVETKPAAPKAKEPAAKKTKTATKKSTKKPDAEPGATADAGTLI